jgi:hypothetical protein
MNPPTQAKRFITSPSVRLCHAPQKTPNATTLRMLSSKFKSTRDHSVHHLAAAGPAPIFTTDVTNVSVSPPVVAWTCQHPGVGKIK